MSEPKQPQPNKPASQTESWNSVIVVIDEPGDTTHRPRRPNIPLEPPPPRRPEPDPRDKKPQEPT